jgi:hypothetical protein
VASTSVQDVGRQHHVVAMGRESLRFRILFYVQKLIAHERVGSKLVARFGDE